MLRALSTLLGTALALILIVGVLLLIGTYTFLPPLVEWAVARDIRERFETPGMPEVELESDPPPTMLAGEFSDGRVLLRDTRFGSIRAQSVTLDLDPFGLRVLDSITNGTPIGEGPLSGRLRVAVSEGEVARLVGANAGVPVSGVELEDSRMLVDSRAMVLGAEVPVSVAGDLQMHRGSLVFEPQQLETAGVRVAGQLADVLLAGAEFAYPLAGLPHGARITGVEVERGRLVLTGRMPDVPLGFEPGG